MVYKSSLTLKAHDLILGCQSKLLGSRWRWCWSVGLIVTFLSLCAVLRRRRRFCLHRLVGRYHSGLPALPQVPRVVHQGMAPLQNADRHHSLHPARHVPRAVPEGAGGGLRTFPGHHQHQHAPGGEEGLHPQGPPTLCQKQGRLGANPGEKWRHPVVLLQELPTDHGARDIHLEGFRSVLRGSGPGGVHHGGEAGSGAGRGGGLQSLRWGFLLCTQSPEARRLSEWGRKRTGQGGRDGGILASPTASAAQIFETKVWVFYIWPPASTWREYISQQGWSHGWVCPSADASWTATSWSTGWWQRWKPVWHGRRGRHWSGKTGRTA